MSFDIHVINKWFFKTSFSSRYSSGTDKNVDDDVQLFKELIEKRNLNCFDKLKYSVTADQLKNTKLSRSNSLSKAVLVLLAKKGPMDLTNGSKVDVGESLSSFNKKEYHHIFPEAFLRGKKVENQKINSVANFTLLPAGSNKLISDKAPSVYFQNIIPKKQYKLILESNVLPLKQDIYIKDEFDNFLEERSEKIMGFLEEQLI